MLTEMLTENCRFPQGCIVLVVEGDDQVAKIVRDFLLEEEQMRHTFQVMNDPDLDRKRLAHDSSYYSAAILAARVKVPGVKITPDHVLALHPDDGKYLLEQGAQLDLRREEFRKEIEALSKGHHPHEKAGLHHRGGEGDEPGGDKGMGQGIRRAGKAGQ